MGDLEKRSSDIIRAAEKAVANIRDPKKRAEAKAVFDATMKKLEASMRPRRGSARTPAVRDRGKHKDKDLER